MPANINPYTVGKNECTCDCKGSMQVVPPAVKLQNTFTAS